ncbi:MAG: hypothetical protein ACKPEA_02150 [Planctomycetota bacterium]
MRRTAPLFQIDPGWLFTIAGLAVMVSAALLPAELDLHDLRQQRAAIAARESWNRERLEAYDRFQGELDRRDPALLRRLAASQLNLMPKGEQPLLMATSIEHTVSDWIEATVPPMEFQPQPAPDTLLARLAEGQRRLWLMAGGAMSVFLGLVLGFGVSPRPQLERFEPLPFPLPPVDAAALEEPSTSESEVETVATVEETEELAAEAIDVEDPLATAEAVPHESFDWPEPEQAFEPAEADSVALHDGMPETALADALAEADEAWMRDHGSD